MEKEYRIIQTKGQNIIGKNIKKIRKERQMKSVEVIAKLELMGVPISASNYCKIEKGVNNPTIDFMLRIPCVLKCSYEDIFKVSEKEMDKAYMEECSSL